MRVQRGKLFHTTKLPGVGLKTRARVLASGLLDSEYTYENLIGIPGLTKAQARAIAEAARAEAEAEAGLAKRENLARTEVRVF